MIYNMSTFPFSPLVVLAIRTTFDMPHVGYSDFISYLQSNITKCADCGGNPYYI
jgi:hypothetical protein